MDIFDIFKERKVGRRMVVPTPKEIAEHEAMMIRGKLLQSQMNEMMDQVKLLEIEKNTWWRNLEKKHGLLGKDLTYQEGEVFELIKRG